MIDEKTAMDVLSIVSTVTGVHSWISGLRSGRDVNRIAAELKGARADIHRLSEHILYATSLLQVRDTTQAHQEVLQDRRHALALLDPVQRALGGDLLSTGMIHTPKRLQEAFSRNPWDVLVEIAPVQRARRPANPALVPILFTDRGTNYVGWQTKGALPSLLDCEYDPKFGSWSLSGQVPTQVATLPTARYGQQAPVAPYVGRQVDISGSNKTLQLALANGDQLRVLGSNINITLMPVQGVTALHLLIGGSNITIAISEGNAIQRVDVPGSNIRLVVAHGCRFGTFVVNGSNNSVAAPRGSGVDVDSDIGSNNSIHIY